MVPITNVLRVVPFCLLFICMLAYAPVDASDKAPESAAGASIVNVYNTSANSVTRRGALRSLNDVVTQKGVETPLWVRDLLVEALGDESPVVVAVAVYQIGNFEVPGLSKKLIALYYDVEKKFSSAYARRVQYSIIPALGKIGGTGVSEFLSHLLAKDNGAAMGQYLLLAIKDLNDPSLVENVKQYKSKMKGLVKFAKTKNYDPLIYSRKQMYVNLALNVEKSLISKGGK